MFFEISMLKIKAQKPVQASFIEHVVNAFSNEQCLNVFVKNPKESITKQQLHIINTPLGRQLDFLKSILL